MVDIAHPGRVLIATPTFDKRVCTDYVVSLLQTMRELAERDIVADATFQGGDCFMDKCRNSLVQQFLEGSYGTLFFIDADQGWDWQGFVRLLFYPQLMVGGVPPKKTDVEQEQFNHVVLDVQENGDCHVDDGLLRVVRCGAGFLRIRREAIEKLLEVYPERIRPNDGGRYQEIPWLFNDGLINGDFWGEDLQLTQRWTDMGEHVWIDPCIRFKHVGGKAWDGMYLEYLQKHANVKVKTNE
jgi:hypothetical protein